MNPWRQKFMSCLLINQLNAQALMKNLMAFSTERALMNYIDHLLTARIWKTTSLRRAALTYHTEDQMAVCMSATETPQSGLKTSHNPEKTQER